MSANTQMERCPDLSNSDRMFFHGVLAALAVVAKYGPTRLFDDIVNSCGRDYLVGIARRSGQMRISGMSQYLRRQNEGR